MSDPVRACGCRGRRVEDIDAWIGYHHVVGISCQIQVLLTYITKSSR